LLESIRSELEEEEDEGKENSIESSDSISEEGNRIPMEIQELEESEPMGERQVSFASGRPTGNRPPTTPVNYFRNENTHTPRSILKKKSKNESPVRPYPSSTTKKWMGRTRTRGGYIRGRRKLSSTSF
jgi:hypothetical protein